jgi:glycosyltransferase involved in cell wall biosynthesis
MIYLALPILNESENLPSLISCLSSQEIDGFELFACVNNFDRWWDDEKKLSQCLDNQESMRILASVSQFKVNIIDKSSRGKAWPEKKGGVGHARKVVMDAISNIASPNDLIVSIDADTYYPSDYLAEIAKVLCRFEIFGLSIPYYHKLNGENDRLLLRYEIYMRYYLLNMLRIKNPFAFTAIGSAMAFPVWAYRKVGGITPVRSGEDFYFLQKLSKSGAVSNWVNTAAFPSARFSGRVDFGTGPALIKGSKGDWGSYPFYPPHLFDMVKRTYDKFPLLFEQDLVCPMDGYLQKQFKTDNIWGALRKNYKDEKNFVKACVNKVDALRILQFLKSVNNSSPLNDACILKEYLKKYRSYELNPELYEIINKLDFDNSPVFELDLLRNWMFESENRLREEQADKMFDE